MMLTTPQTVLRNRLKKALMHPEVTQRSPPEVALLVFCAPCNGLLQPAALKGKERGVIEAVIALPPSCFWLLIFH